MKNQIPGSFSSTNPPKQGNRSFWQWLVAPTTTITDSAERRQASLVSAILIAVILSMIVGIVVETSVIHDMVIARTLTSMEFFLVAAYILSRTRHYRTAVFLQLVVYASWPIANIVFRTDYSPINILIVFMFNMITMILSGTLAPYSLTVFLAVGNILWMVLVPFLFPSIPFTDLILPISFNSVGSLLILILTRHRDLVENDRLTTIAQINDRLQIELQERKRAEEQITYSATHDALTNLPNRTLLMDRIQHAMERAKRHKNFKFAVLFLDLDRFKVVNDSLGHKAGDLLLVESASRLTACLRREDMVARLGGDEFVILLEGVKDTFEVIHITDRVQHDLALPHELEGHKVFVFASIGVVLSADRYERPDDILRDADIAMYRAKGLGRGRSEIFDVAMLDHIMSRLELENDLRKAVEAREFILHYQPIFDIQNRRIVGFEALLRWQHPARGLILPADFIPTAEETGVIVPIGYWVLEEACRQLRVWQSQFPNDPPLTINVNWSTRQCAEPDLVQKIAKILHDTSLDPHFLNLELTESLVVEDTDATNARLSELRALGVQVQIDDFGTGYSSLGYLHTLPIDTLKLDRTFISRLGINDNGSEIVRTILMLAHDLGMKVVAEGVETTDQLATLKAMNCEFIQGFLIAKPLDQQEVGSLLRKSLTEDDPGTKQS